MENMNRNQKIDADNLEENKDIMRCNFLIDNSKINIIYNQLY